VLVLNILLSRRYKTEMTNEVYVLSRSEVENERLDEQHRFIRKIYDNRLILDDKFDFSSLVDFKVLDAGTGSGIWLFDLARFTKPSATLIGTDIAATFNTKVDVPSNVRFIQQSTLSLPPSWTSTFDFVQQRLMLAAFTEAMWTQAISEHYRVLKPGGHIQLVEGVVGGIDPLNAWTRFEPLFSAISKKRGLLGDPTGRIEKFLKDAGFVDIRVVNRRGPAGGAAGERGSGRRIAEPVITMYLKALMAEGGLGVYQSESDAWKALDEAKKEWDERPDMYLEYLAVLARKPL